MKPLEKLMAHIYSEKHYRNIGMKSGFGDFTDEEIESLISELEATQSLKEKIGKLNPNMCDDDYSDGYYAAINAVEKILNGGSDENN